MVDIDVCSPAPEPEPVSVPAHPDPSSISPDAWRRFESATDAVVRKIQPTVSSDRLRAAVIDYVQRLFKYHVGCQVFPFGSVPLKTYLPDGDIDLTAFGPATSDENIANEVRAILLSEERRKDAEFEVKDVQCINAEVKLVKCLVQNIVVDISFNQFGGLCTLCFLEKVDQVFGKNHIFKRSIVLIKDWCYYESRILGAHHGLISTYALEILVLYILHVFHKSLDGPLAVLYRFLDYYSKFDWDNKGISLFGPVSLSSLPELVNDSPDTHDDGFLQREEFIREFAEEFSVPPRNSESNARVFSRKFLNIVDPLKQSNNLGRSVSKGNFYRIRSAFDLGARKLGKTLQVPASSTVSEVNQFFRNTLKRNRTGVRPDVLVSPCDGLLTDNSNYRGDLSSQLNNISISCSNTHGSIKQKECNSMGEQTELKYASKGLPGGDATNYTGTHSVRMGNDDDFYEASPSGRAYHAPHLSCQSENGKKTDVKDDTNKPQHEVPEKWFAGRSRHSFDDAKYHNEFSRGGAANDTVSDLTGDFGTNCNNLMYARHSQLDNQTNQVYYQMLGPPPAQYRNTQPSNGHGRKKAYGYSGTNGVPGPPFSPYVVFRPFYQTDDPTVMRARGTGTYFPDPNLRKDRPSSGRGERGKNHFPQNNYQKFHHYVRTDMPADVISLDGFGQELPMQIYVPGAYDHGMPSPLKIPMPSPSSQSPREPFKVPIHSPSSQAPRDVFHGNGSMHPQDSEVEFGTLGTLPVEGTSKDQASRSGSSSSSQASGPVSPISAAQTPEMGPNRMRNGQRYHLKDNGDFPPLSS
ncbi:hypothetical protein ACP70R_046936 [Stipagrostis hirtigluma subsp. patula]